MNHHRAVLRARLLADVDRLRQQRPIDRAALFRTLLVLRALQALPYYLPTWTGHNRKGNQ